MYGTRKMMGEKLKGKKKTRKGKYKIFLVLLFVENSKEKEKIHFPLFGNYIEKLRKI